MHIQVYFVGQELNLWEISVGLVEENRFAYKMSVGLVGSEQVCIQDVSWTWEFNNKHVTSNQYLSSEMIEQSPKTLYITTLFCCQTRFESQLIKLNVCNFSDLMALVLVIQICSKPS